MIFGRIDRKSGKMQKSIKQKGLEMKLIILGGFLGSGKTRFLIPLARELTKSSSKSDGVKIAIIENEIGSVGIDNVFTEGEGYTSREFFNGCVFLYLTCQMPAVRFIKIHC
ncbi:MAG: hypothetical protein HUJ63_09130, partial [Enterococcus sp.]|nr:hypothetical protein [Enterococcus sp.]